MRPVFTSGMRIGSTLTPQSVTTRIPRWHLRHKGSRSTAGNKGGSRPHEGRRQVEEAGKDSRDRGLGLSSGDGRRGKSAMVATQSQLKAPPV